MAAISHSFAYYTGLPLAGSNITPAGGTALTTCRVVSAIIETSDFRVNNEDISESGHLVGERHDDKKTTIKLTLSVPVAYALPEKGTVITIAGATGSDTRYNGTWKVENMEPAFKSDDKMEVPLTLVKHQYLTYSAS